MTLHQRPITRDTSSRLWARWRGQKEIAAPSAAVCPRSPGRINVEEFGKRHGLDEDEIRQLQLLFGPFADRDEL